MSLFGNILSLQDAINRLPQFEYQINKLEKEEKGTHRRGSLRTNFIRQCQELHKQIDEHRRRTENARTDEKVRKEETLEQIDTLKERLSRLAPPAADEVKITSSGSESSSSNNNRRKSVMYDGDDSQEDSDRETEIIETDVHLEEPPPPPPPQPKPRQPIAITQPSVQPQSGRAVMMTSDMADEIALLQNPAKNDPSDVMEPVVVKGNVFTAVADLPAETEGDLSLKKGRKYRITQTRADGWWTALDEDGKRGLVPKTYLQHHKEKHVVQSKLSNRFGVRDSVIGITATATQPRRAGEEVVTKQKECLGKEFDTDPHLSLVCHLAPRLSTSNIGFHDLFWSHEKDQVFKRTVHISKIVRLVRFENMPLVMNKALVRMALVDVTNPKATQIVSNVHTLVPRVKNGTWYFEKKESQTRNCLEFSDVVLRSNYSSPTVVLVVEASHIVLTNHSSEEKSLGCTWLRLIIDDKAVVSKTNVLYLDDEIMTKMKMPDTGKRRVFLQVMDVPKDKVAMVDSLPDVIVFNSLYLPFFHFYRRRAGTILIRDNRNPLSAEFVSDPLLSMFPSICEQHDVMDAILKLWKGKKKLLAKKTEAEQAAEFFQTFIRTAFFIEGSGIIEYDVKDDSCLEDRKRDIEPIINALNRGALRECVASRKYHPINIVDYSLDLLGPHSID